VMFKKCVVGMVIICVAGCASKSGKIEANYVSPLAYANYDCDMLTAEYARLVQQSSKINKQQDDVAGNDSVAMGVGLILFWPALFFIDNDDMREQVAQLKGEVNAVEQASIQKKCTMLSDQMSADKAAADKAIEDAKNKKK